MIHSRIAQCEAREKQITVGHSNVLVGIGMKAQAHVQTDRASIDTEGAAVDVRAFTAL